jgi:hypothetical protein
MERLTHGIQHHERYRYDQLEDEDIYILYDCGCILRKHIAETGSQIYVYYKDEGWENMHNQRFLKTCNRDYD